MVRPIPLFTALVCAVILFSPLPQFVVAEHSISRAQVSTSSFIPLPSRCGIGLPPNQSSAVCCMFGYVFIDGEAALGARVTITGAHGSAELWTEQGDDSPQPYYRVNLSGPPLNVEAGDAITIKAEYSGHSREMTYTARGGGQQIDLVLPRNQASDFVFDRQIWHQARPGGLNIPSSVAVDPTGTIYVADRGNQRIQVFNNKGEFLRQWGAIGGQPRQFVQPFGIAIDRSSNVYVIDSDNHRIQKFSSTGEWLETWGGEGNGDGQFRFPRNLAIDRNGNVYVADTYNHRIQQFTSDGTFVRKWGSLGSANGQFREVNGITVDDDGYVYAADSNNHRVQKFRSDGTFVTKWGGFGSGDGQFHAPDGITVDHNGYVYVVDTNNHRVQKFRSDGTFVTKWGDQGTADGQFFYPRGAYADANNMIYVADTYNYRVQQFTSNGAFVATLGTRGSDDGQFFDPKGVSLDYEGHLYVADTRNHRIQKFRSDGTFVTKWGSLGTALGEFSWPRAVTVDRFGNVYVADTENNRIQKFRSDGTAPVIWGPQGGQPVEFKHPWSIVIDRNDFVYVADTNNMRILKFTLDGTYVDMWGYAGSSDGEFKFPQGVAVDRSGYVYVVDTYNHRIQKFTNTGDFVTKWGTQGSADGQFNLPQNATVDAQGNVYVSDDQNHRIQKFTSNGEWLATIGTRGGLNGQFEGPHGLSIDQNGHLYVSDSVHQRIQVFRPMTFNQPFATIAATGARDVTQGETIDLYGIGGDSDETTDLAAYEWMLDDSNTPFATTSFSTLDTDGLTLGEHTINFRVRDTEGSYSAVQRLSINVGPGIHPPVETWTFLLYLDGDQSNIAPYLNRDSALGALYRLEHSPVKEYVQVVALYDGPRIGGGDSFRYIQQPNGQFNIEARGELNMGDPQTLIDFVRWGKQRAPADHYYLAIANHANGLEGIAWDLTSGVNERLTVAELRLALADITNNGSLPIDVLHLDGCLMGLMESAYQVRGMAHYLIASENLAWSIFDYSTYRSTIENQTSPRTLAATIVEKYAERVEAEDYPYTIAALDLSKTNQVLVKTDALAKELQRFALSSSASRTSLGNLRKSVQKLDSNGTITITEDDEYIDLRHLAQLAESRLQDSAVQGAAASLNDILPTFFVREHHSSGRYNDVPVNLDWVGGLGIYYPLHHTARTYNSYVRDLTFATDTHWDEFLAAALATSNFEPTDPPHAPVAPLPIHPRTYLPITGS